MMENKFNKTGKVIWQNGKGIVEGTNLDTTRFPDIQENTIGSYDVIRYYTFSTKDKVYIGEIMDKYGHLLHKIQKTNTDLGKVHSQQAIAQKNKRTEHPPKSESSNNNDMSGNQPAPRNMPTSPFNFIPLPESIVPSPWQSEDKVPDLVVSQEDCYSGYIDVTLKNLTDLFIGNTTQFESDFIKKQCHGIKDKDSNPVIMGSSTRGMYKNLMEILSFANISNVGDTSFYYRKLTDIKYRSYYTSEEKVSLTKSQKEEYITKIERRGNQNEINNAQRFNSDVKLIKFKPELQAGYLKKVGNDYKIIPCQKDKFGNQFYKIRKPNKKDEFTECEIWFQPVNKESHVHLCKPNPIPQLIEYPLVKRYSLSEDNSMRKGVVICSGNISGKHDDWIINEAVTDDGSSFPVGKDLIKAYEQDKMLGIGEKFKITERIKGTHPVPIFFLTDDSNAVIGFGHTAFFRFKYKKSVFDQLPKYENQLDYTQAMFGKLGKITTRLHFGTAKMKHYVNDKNKEVKTPHWHPSLLTLQSAGEPKPTYHLFYLEQNPSPKTWDDDTQIRGHKLYHHQNVTNPYKYTPPEARKKADPSMIQPLFPGHVFEQRIHFTNLSKEELGLLLLAITLKNSDTNMELRHKLGFGKQHGLGSMEINIRKMTLINRQKRYTTLFDKNNKINLGETEESDYDSYITAFIEDVLKTVSTSETSFSVNEFWALPRMQELAAMLNYKNTGLNDWQEKTKYMDLEMFKRNFQPLPRPKSLLKI